MKDRVLPFTTKGSWRIFRIMAEWVDTFETLSTVTDAVEEATNITLEYLRCDHPAEQVAGTLPDLPH